MATDRVVQIAIALVLVAALFGPFVGAVSSNTGTESVVNETVTANVGEYVALEGVEIESGSVTVYNATDDVQVEGTDYAVGYDNSSIKALSGGNVTDGNTIKVSYTNRLTSTIATTIADLIPLMLLVTIIGVVGMGVKSMTSGRGGL